MSDPASPPPLLLIAPDSFKGTFNAADVARIVANAASTVLQGVESSQLPMADGGEGSAEILALATGGSLVAVGAHDPLGRPIEAELALLGDGQRAALDMAAASGLPRLTPDERNPLIACSYGSGEVIAAALERGFERLILGVGGTATVDGGAGIARALGARLLDGSGQPIPRGGAGLLRLERIEMPPPRRLRIELAVDVNNPALGQTGAAAVYGPQKGADPAAVGLLERGLYKLSCRISELTGIEAADLAGAGAGGAVALCLVPLFGATIRSGAALVAKSVGLESLLARASAVVVGEGRFDGQSDCGKAPAYVARQAQRQGVPVLVLAGQLALERRSLLEAGIRDAEAASPNGPPAERGRAERDLVEAAVRLLSRNRSLFSS